MTACNARPAEGHPFYRPMVACHMHAGHDGPHTWEAEPSNARRGLDRLLGVFWHREVEKVDSQLPHPIEVYAVDEDGVRAAEPYRRWDLAAGPWMLVTFVGGDEYAIWKQTGAVYRVGPDGAVDEDPIIEINAAAG